MNGRITGTAGNMDGWGLSADVRVQARANAAERAIWARRTNEARRILARDKQAAVRSAWRFAQLRRRQKAALNPRLLRRCRAKVIILVLHSRAGVYNDLMRIQGRYLDGVCRANPNLSWYKYYFDEDAPDDHIDEESKSIVIRGKESLNPGCRVKTYRAMRLLEGRNYDYLVRINEATVVDYAELCGLLDVGRPHYAGECVSIKSAWDTEELPADYAGLRYVRGRCIAMSKVFVNAVLRYLRAKHDTENVLDDVSIGLIAWRLGVPIFDIWPAFRELRGGPGGFVFTHKTPGNRRADVARMAETVAGLKERLPAPAG